MWKNIYTFIVIKAFSVTLEKLNKKFPGIPAPYPSRKQKIVQFSSPTQKLAARTLALAFVGANQGIVGCVWFTYTECKYGGLFGRRPGRVKARLVII